MKATTKSFVFGVVVGAVAYHIMMNSSQVQAKASTKK